MNKEVIYLGADHAGFKLKEVIKEFLTENSIEVEDLSKTFKSGDDYPDTAFLLGEKVAKEKARGILICGTGEGMAIAANKVKGIRATEAIDITQAKLARADNDSNVLVIGSWLVKEATAREIVSKWIRTPFSNLERHKRRLAKIEKYEK